MITNGIKIKWDYGTEYISVNMDSLAEETVISTTLEWWPDEEMFVKYESGCRIEMLDNGDRIITLNYEQNKNEHLEKHDVSWGESKIVIGKNSAQGQAYWFDSIDADSNEIVTWEKIALPLRGSKKKTDSIVTSAERNQAKFRSALFACNPCCDISGETTAASLEAAHIIPSKDGGEEQIQNGLLLRADLHRLYDGNIFTINPDTGKVIVNREKEISEAYKKMLTGFSLQMDTLSRTREALSYQWNRNN